MYSMASVRCLSSISLIYQFPLICIPSYLCQLTEGDGITLAKDGACHKLLIDSCQEEHSGRYRFEAEGRKTEATIYVQGIKMCLEVSQYNIIKSWKITYVYHFDCNVFPSLNYLRPTKTESWWLGEIFWACDCESGTECNFQVALWGPRSNEDSVVQGGRGARGRHQCQNWEVIQPQQASPQQVPTQGDWRN